MSVTETPQRIEPALIEGAIPEEVAALAVELTAAAASLSNALHPRAAASLADLVRIMNAYYSNLIEGHNTRPADIVRALEGHVDANPERRNLQIEAIAHVHVQREIDEIFGAGNVPEPASIAFIQRLHRRFYDGATPQMLAIKNGERRYQMVPGAFRTTALQDVVLGPSSASFKRSRSRLHGVFCRAISPPAANDDHAGFHSCVRTSSLQLHPSVSGRQRTSESSHEPCHAPVCGVGAHGLWSVSRASRAVSATAASTRV